MKTHSAIATADSVTVHGLDLCSALIGVRSFTETLYFSLTHRFPNPAELRLLDAVLVTLMEHGHNPSTLIARLMAFSVPEEAQVAIGAGIMAVGGVLAGTMAECGAILDMAVSADSTEAECNAIVARHREDRVPVPGFGHATHKPDDPRAIRLLELATEEGAGAHVAALHVLAAEVDSAFGRHITINATGAIAAILLDIGLPLMALRGIGAVSRAGGLLTHLIEERNSGSARAIVAAARDKIPYVDP